MAKLNELDRKLIRILYIVSAIILGSLAMLGITYVSDLSNGPVANAFEKLGDEVRKIENITILENRKNERQDRMIWFKDYRNDYELLRHPETILLGAHDNQCGTSFESVVSLEDSIGNVFPIIHIYVAWGEDAEHAFPTIQASAISNMGSVPMITWEPWLTKFSSATYSELRNAEERSMHGLTDIANGLYDPYIISWAKAVKAIRTPIFLRWGHEMNDPYRYPWGPQNNSPEEYVAAWKHIHHVFATEGATNVLWVWNPHISYGNIDEYYPGDDMVDYTGVDILNFGTATTWSDWYTFDQYFGKYYDLLAAHNKPIMIAELGSLAVGGDRKEWFTGALQDLPTRYPAVKSVVFFHVSEDKTTSMQPLSWYFKYDTACTHAIVQEIEKWSHLNIVTDEK